MKPSKIGAVALPRGCKNRSPGVKACAKLKLLEPPLAESVILGRRAAIATPTSALAECMLASAALHVGPLIDKLARQADRQIGRQLEMGEIEFLLDLVGGSCPASAVSRSRCWANCFSSGGSSCSAGCECRVLRQHIGLRRLTDFDCRLRISSRCARSR